MIPGTKLAGHLNLAGHLDLAGCYSSKCPAVFKCPANPSVNVMNLPGIEHSAPTISNWKADASPKSYLGMSNQVRTPF